MGESEFGNFNRNWFHGRKLVRGGAISLSPSVNFNQGNTHMLQRNSETFTLQELYEWAKKKDPNEKYEYTNTYQCAIAQFIQDRHPGESVHVGPSSYSVGKNRYDLPFGADIAANGYSSLNNTNTFGGFAERLAIEIERQGLYD